MKIATFRPRTAKKRIFNHPEDLASKISLDIMTIGNVIFYTESLLQKRKINSINIFLYNDYGSELNSILEEILELTTRKRVKINQENQTKEFEERKTETKKDAVCLFSGGVDSFSGILNSKIKYNNLIGIYIKHFPKLYKVIEFLTNNVLDSPVLSVPAVVHRSFWAQTRGFLYIMSAAAYAYQFDTKNIIISECGPTMFQIPFVSEMDTVTMTTHPELLEKTKKLLRIITGNDYSLIKPNEDLTKSEIISNTPNQDYLKSTHSCRITRWIREPIETAVSHDGYCYGCVIRKLSFLTANVQDCEYAFNIFSKNIGDIDIGIGRNNIIRKGHYENILPLLKELVLKLLNGDEIKIPYFIMDPIKRYGKYELFRRFSLDICCGLYELYENRGAARNAIIYKIYKQILSSITKEEIENRIAEVRERRFKPDFSNMI